MDEYFCKNLYGAKAHNTDDDPIQETVLLDYIIVIDHNEPKGQGVQQKLLSLGNLE